MEKESILDEIKNPKLFVVEGINDCQFFIKLLDHICIKGFHVRPVEGKDKFKRKISALATTTGFPKLTHLAIIRDKEEDNAFQSVQNILKEIGIPNIPQQNGEVIHGKLTVGVFILPGNIEGKMLEDLCLKIVESEPSMKCVNEFAKCVLSLGKPPKNPSKAKLLAYLASQQEPVNTIGIAAEKGYWDFDSPALSELVTFLMKFQ